MPQDNTTAIVRQDTDLMWDPAGFEHAQRLAKMFAQSAMVPEHLRGKLPDVTIALLMARRLGEDPLIVMQNIHFVKGKAGWNTQYVIARANRSEVFRGRINWRERGEGKDLEVEAYATLADTGEEVSFAASMEMARAEKWDSNPKYRSLPKLMLRYRSAAFLVRLYAPDVMLGVPTSEELETTPVTQAVPVNRPTGRAALGLTPEAPQLEERVDFSEPVDLGEEPEPVHVETEVVDDAQQSFTDAPM